MPVIYRLLTGVIAVSGCFALVTTGELNPVFYLFIFIMLFGYYRLLHNRPQAPKRLVGFSSAVVFVIFLFDIFTITQDYLTAVGHLTFMFHAIKSFDIKDPYDPLQVYFMSLLQLVVAAEFTIAILFGITLIFFVITLLFAIVLAHYIKFGRGHLITVKQIIKPVTVLTVLTLIFSTIFFVSMPRLRFAIFGKSHIKGIKSVGFSEKIDLGSFSDLKLDPTIVMRVEMEPMIPGPYYWRGTTLNYFDGKSWNSTLSNIRKTVPRTGDEFIIRPFSGNTITQRVMLEPLDSNVIFGLDSVVSITGDFTYIEKDAYASIFIVKRGPRRLQYTAKSNISSSKQPLSDDLRHKDIYLDILDDLRETLKPFTENVLKAENIKVFMADSEKVSAVERYLKRNYHYSLYVKQPPDSDNPIRYFLFESKTGYCEHYASAMTLMLRSIGIPARIVIGFINGEVNEFGNYIIVRQLDAHSWVEAWIHNKWQRFDPTPPQSEAIKPNRIFLYLDLLKMNWQRYVVGFSRQDQTHLMRMFGYQIPGLNISLQVYYKKTLIIILSLAVLTLFVIVYISRKKKQYPPIISGFLKVRSFLKKKGCRLNEYASSQDVINEAARINYRQDVVREFVRMYEEWRFGGVPINLDYYQVLMKQIMHSKSIFIF